MSQGTILDVLIVGAGFGGLCAGKVLRDQGIENFKIYDKAPSIGGTWYHNTYPGAACDVPSHFYSYSFEPNPDWSRKYSPQPEILSYIKHCAQKYGLTAHIELGRKIERFVFDEKTALWAAHFEDGQTQMARQIINAMGGLHQPKYPDIKGLKTFKGPVIHSAKWDHDVDFTSKSVVIIGSAASAVQIIPELAKTAKTLHVFQRTPNYIIPRHDRDFTEGEKRRFARWPWLARLYRWAIYQRLEKLVFPILVQKSPLTGYITRSTMKWMREEVPDPAKHTAMEPDYKIGCKRILVSDNFYATMAQDHVNLIADPIKAVTGTGIRTEDGQLHKADIIVLATGYDIDAHMVSIDVVGTGGVSLNDLGPDGAEAFKGACHPHFPNFYLTSGPNTGVGSTSVIHMIELQMDYVIQLVKAAHSGKIISVKPEALRQFNDNIQEQLSSTVWASGCDSWYVREDGKIVTLYPGNAKDFAREHKYVDWENYNVIEAPALEPV